MTLRAVRVLWHDLNDAGLQLFLDDVIIPPERIGVTAKTAEKRGEAALGDW